MPYPSEYRGASPRGGVPSTMATPDGAPRRGLPQHSTIAYAKDSIALLLLLVAAPWLLYHLLTKPSAVLTGRGPTGVV